MAKCFNDDVVILIEKILKIFSEKKNNKKISNRIVRGRASASADAFEEELAKLIEKHVPEPINILVDYPISYKLMGAVRAKTIYPDIALVCERTILAIIEAKIDLGFLKDDWAKNRSEMFKGFKSANDISGYTISEKFSSCCVVLTAKNDHGRLDDFLEQPINPIVLILEDHLHPNDDNLVNDIGYFDRVTSCSKNHEQWKLLESFLVSVI
ncbi:MAG: hypothetical protein U1B30_11100 [Pseudomonadota bacterium]|nr:hypothetical protein [Pseudomonadota bacterium]